MRRHFTENVSNLRLRPNYEACRQNFVGKVEVGFDVRERLGQAAAPRIVKLAKITIELTQGLAALGRSLGIDQVGDRFGFGQVELTIFEGAPSESPGSAGRIPSICWSAAARAAETA